jgi:peptidyl-prolyl cis-trans isomerase B (cyclophilin B)
VAASRREKELARQRAERQAARRAAEAARRKQRNAVLATVLAVALVAVALVVVTTRLGNGGGTASTVASGTSATPSPSASPSASQAPGTCTYDDAGKAAKAVRKPPTAGVETKGTYRATMVTNNGTVVFDMDAAKTPCTVNSMRSLAHFAYFDATPCHRLTTSGIYVLQCGDPTGSGTGGPGYRFADENLKGATYPRGTLAMANSGASTNGSQFFLVYKNSQLPPSYTPFGHITSGLDVLDKIAKAGSEPADKNNNTAPKLKTTIKTMRTSLVSK